MTIYTQKDMERIQRSIEWAAFKQDAKRLVKVAAVFAVIIGIYALAGSV